MREEYGMLEKVKMSIKRPTVIIALVAVILGYVSQYLPWLTDRTHSQTLAQAIAEKPDYFIGFPAILLIGFLWVAVWFLLNHPKLTLVGILPLQFIWLVMLMIASDYGISLGLGFWVYVIMQIVCVVMVFATKKIKKEK